MRKQITVEARQRGIITRLKNETKRQRERIKYLEERDREKDQVIEAMALQIKELQTIVFGKKKNKDDDQFFGSNDKIPKTKIKRDNSSYRRSTPNDNEITKEESYTIDACPDCGSFLIKKTKVFHYIEDIMALSPIPPQTS